MDTVKSFRGYGKVDPAEEQTFRRKTRKRIVILVVAILLLAALVIGVVAGTVAHKKNKNGDNNAPSTQASAAQSLKAMCSVTSNPESCYASISSLDSSNPTSDPQKLFQLSLEVILNALQELSTLPQGWMNTTTDPQVRSALRVCQTVFDDAIDAANDTISSAAANAGQSLLSASEISNLKTWLSTSLTNLETCVDALDEVNATIVDDVKAAMTNSTEFASNSLAIVAKFLAFLDRFNIPTQRKLLQASSSPVDSSRFPHWVRAADRRLLQASLLPKPNITVAQDGSGNYKTVSEAVANIPKKSKYRFVIYIKAGVYREQVTVNKNSWNVMMYGDGMDKTILTYNKNFVDGTPTFATATFTVAGKSFIAKNMAFQNSAGAIKHQAVALRSASDQSVFYQCLFDGYQDTLYAHSNRQFYSQCNITGTIDFIFGNAAVIFQSCNILPRNPLAYQFITVTAQGKIDPNQNTGITIQNCVIAQLDSIKSPAYLGRPWKNYSTTVIMQSSIGSFLTPSGWIGWTAATPPSTIFYAESQNTGPGSNVAQRVKWAGYKSRLTTSQAAQFTVGSFINGQEWIPAAQVKYT